MARLISVYRFLAVRHLQLNYLTLYHHAEDFKKIAKASHEADNSYEKIKNARELNLVPALEKL